MIATPAMTPPKTMCASGLSHDVFSFADFPAAPRHLRSPVIEDPERESVADAGEPEFVRELIGED